MRKLSDSMIASQFPVDANVHCVLLAGGSGREYMLYPHERAAIATAIPARQQEFARGRHAARTALAEAGLDAGELAVTPTGRPDWPADTVGSISHVETHAVAVVARESDACLALGVDLVRVNRSPLEVASQFMSSDELAHTHAHRNAVEWACIVLACKEASFKAIGHLVAETIPRIEDVRITMDPGRCSFGIAAVAHGRDDIEASGRWTVAQEWVIATTIMKRR